MNPLSTCLIHHFPFLYFERFSFGAIYQFFVLETANQRRFHLSTTVEMTTITWINMNCDVFMILWNDQEIIVCFVRFILLFTVFFCLLSLFSSFTMLLFSFMNTSSSSGHTHNLMRMHFQRAIFNSGKALKPHNNNNNVLIFTSFYFVIKSNARLKMIPH